MKHLLRIPTFRRLALAPVIAAAVAGLIAGATTSARSGDITMAIDVDHTPGTVARTPDGATRLNFVAFPITIENNGPSNATAVNVRLRAPGVCTRQLDSSCTLDMPAVYAAFDSAFLAIGTGSQSPITCAVESADPRTRVCSLGTIRPGPSNKRTLTAVYVTPANGDALSFVSEVFAKDGAVSTGAVHAFPPQTEIVPLGGQDGNGTYVKPKLDGDVTTDPNNDPTKVNQDQDPYLNSGNPMSTNASFKGGVNPNGVGALIQELAGSCSDGSCLGQQVSISIGLPYTQKEPLELFFRLDASVSSNGTLNAKKVTIEHDGTPLSVCPKTDPLPTAGCIFKTIDFKDKDAGVGVRSLSNGTWKFGGG